VVYEVRPIAVLEERLDGINRLPKDPSGPGLEYTMSRVNVIIASSRGIVLDKKV
jgi:hypothetical protein